MAEDSYKTEEPTEHKLQEARKKGQVFKSQDAVATFMLLVTCAILYALGSSWVTKIKEFTRSVYIKIGSHNYFIPSSDTQVYFLNDIFRIILMAVFTIAIILIPLLVIAFIAAIVINVVQTKLIFSLESLNPTLNKINPIEGFKKIFSAKSVMELFKQLAKLTVVTLICYNAVKNELGKFTNFVYLSPQESLAIVKQISVKIIEWVIVAMAAISIIDYMFQRQQFMKQMKMSMQELKDEYKDTEGNPQVKGKIRQLMRQSAQGRMMEEVPNSSAVITNPTHLAVAVKYEPGVTKAPMVVAKGERNIAVQIKVLAEDSNVPII